MNVWERIKMKNTQSLRDAFWDRVYDIARTNRDVTVVCADMGAPALDKFKRDLNTQFVDVGIAEQQAIAVASGMGLGGKKVFAYAIAPFITLRCYEHIRIELSGMHIPVTLVGVGAGFSYEDSGPTHHALEDIAALRIFPNIKINNITDIVMARAFAEISCKISYPNYVRLDRHVLPVIYNEESDFSPGLAVLKEGAELAILATGNMVHRALEVAEKLKKQSIKARVIDVYTFPIDKEVLLKSIRGVNKLVTLEEQTLAGGLGTMVSEILTDSEKNIPLKRLGLDLSKGYVYKYGGRENILSYYGLDVETILSKIKKFLK